MELVSFPKESSHEASLISFHLHGIAGCLTGCH